MENQPQRVLALIDFAEDGRLLAAAEQARAKWDAVPDLHLRFRYAVGLAADYATRRDAALVALRNHAAAYRDAVLAAKAFRDKVRECVESPSYTGMVHMAHAHGWVHNGPDWIEEAAKIDAALARFRNITEGQS